MIHLLIYYNEGMRGGRLKVAGEGVRKEGGRLKLAGKGGEACLFNKKFQIDWEC